MTNYQYVEGMERICFETGQAMHVLENKGLEDFYKAAATGFTSLKETMPVTLANEPINESQMESYLVVDKFLKDKRKQATDKLAREALC